MTAGLPAALLSVCVIAAFLLAGGGLRLVLRAKDRKQGALMLVLAAVLLANVLVWALPAAR